MMETYFTEVKVQADRYIVETDKPTIIVENEEVTEEEFNKRYGTNTGEDCGCAE